MSFVVVAVLYPLLLGVLSLGGGLLVESIAGFRLPFALVPAVGYGALVVVSQLSVLSPSIAPYTPVVLVVVALLGFAINTGSIRNRWRSRKTSWFLLPLAGVAAYLTVALPLIAAGRLTFPGYLLDTTAGLQLAGGEWMLHHGAPLPPATPAYGAMLHDYWGEGYPSGSQVLLAATGWLSGQDLLWLYFPFQVFSLALSALVLTFLAERAGLARWPAAVTGWIASVPALVVAYAMMGSIKEMTALPLLLLMGALIVVARDYTRIGVRGLAPFAVAAGGAIGAIGPSAVAWIGVFGVAGLIFLFPRLLSFAREQGTRPSREIARRAWSGAAAGVLLLIVALPTLTRLAPEVQTASNLSGASASLANDPGNLLRPLRFVQVFGIWLGGSHRVDPRYLNETYALIGVAIVAGVLGVVALVRRRRWVLLASVIAWLVVWAALFARGTEWTDAKVMMLTSPAVVLVCMIGAFGDLRSQRLQGLLLAILVGGGVIISDALLYHDTNMAPTARFTELRSIGERFGNQGPSLLPDFDEYAFYLLRKLDVDSPGFAADMRRPFTLSSGSPGYGHSYDIDDIEQSFVQQFNLIVMRRSPRWSRPPGNFRLVWRGHYYEVWRRDGAAPLFHVPAGSGLEPVGTVACPTVHSLATQAEHHDRELRYAVRPANAVANLAAPYVGAGVATGVDGDGFPMVSWWGGAGVAEAPVRVPVTGRYSGWLGGAVDRPMVVSIDGRNLGAPSDQSGGEGNMIGLGSVQLTAGHHVVGLVRTGGGLSPGNDSGATVDGVYLARGGAADEAVVTIPASSWRRLCGRTLDWLEVT